MNFITTSGSQFRDGTKRFRFVGVNDWDFGKLSTSMPLSDIQSTVGYMKADGISVVRISVAGNESNSARNYRYISGSTLNWREASFVQIDNVLNELSNAGIRCILHFTDEFNWGTDKSIYCGWSNTVYGTSYDTTTGDNFHTDNNIITWFKEYCAQFINRVNTVNGITYKNDPTIFAWELGNELRYRNDGLGGETNTGTTSSSFVATLSSWQSTMAAYIKSLDSNHLVSAGDTAHFVDDVVGDSLHDGTASYGQDFINMSKDENIDYFDFHMYPWASNPTNTLNKYGQSLGYPNSASFNGWLAQLDQYVYYAKLAGKPIIIGELGISLNNNLNDLLVSYPRHVALSNILKHFFNRNGDGILLWHYKIEDQNNYGIYPVSSHSVDYSLPSENANDTNLRSIISQINYKINGKRILVDKIAPGTSL